MNKARLKKILDEIDAMVAEAADHPPVDEDELNARALDIGRLEAAKDILRAIIKRPASRLKT